MLSSEEEEEEDHEDIAEDSLGSRWEDTVNYDPENIPMEKFQEHITHTRRTGSSVVVGLQCHPMDVNTPIRAWRQIFTRGILDKLVKYTNEYGARHCKTWSDISRKDIEAFIAVLFVSRIQKRKDKTSNWFSNNPLLENPVMKRIMSGRQFHTILRYLHCCPAVNQDPNAPGYDPGYKVAELRDALLERRYNATFIPGQQLSLDETLIRAFA